MYTYRAWKFYLSIAFMAVLLLIPPALLTRLNINNAPKIYFAADAPSVVIDERLRETFPSDQVIALLFEGEDLFSDHFLQALHSMAQKLETHPLVDSVWTVTSVDHVAGTEDGFEVAPLIDTKRLAESTPAERLAAAVGDRFAKSRLVTEDGTGLTLVVVPHTLDTSLARLDLYDAVIADTKDAGIAPQLTAVAGQIAVDVAELHSMFRDNMTFIPFTTGIGLLLVWWLFRRPLAVLLTGLTIGAVVNGTVLFYVLFDQPFNLISTITPPLLSALTVAAMVHLFNALNYAARRGLSGSERIRRALEEVRRPALFTALTTIAGLASLATSPIIPVGSFGLIAAAGVMLTYLLVIHVVPHLMARWDHADWPHTEGGLKWMDAMVRRLSHLGIRYPLAVVVGTGLLLVAGSPEILRVKAESSLQEFFIPDHPVRVATDRFQARLSGTTSLDVIFETPKRDGLTTPANLKAIRDFQLWVEQLPEVDRSFSAADIIEEMNWAFHEEDPTQRRIPDKHDLISQYLLIYDGEDLYDFIDKDFKLSRVALNVNVHKANEIRQVMDRIRTYLEQHVGNSMQWEIAGDGRLFADMSELLVTGQVYSLWGALGLIFLLMIILWRSVKDAVLCMIPNLSPILLIFILMGLANIWLDLATAMIASVAVGIAVDDTIHLYHGFIKRFRQGVEPVLALVRTLHQAGRAVMTTTIILCAQFMVLIFSQFVPTTHFGMLTSIGLLSALLFDIILMPAILMLIYGRRKPGSP